MTGFGHRGGLRRRGESLFAVALVVGPAVGAVIARVTKNRGRKALKM